MTGLWASALEPGVQVVGLGEPVLGNCTLEVDAAAEGMAIIVPAGEYLLTTPYANTESGFPLIGPSHYPFSGVPWGVRMVGDPAALIGAVQRKLREIEPSRAVYEVRPLDDALPETLGRARFQSYLVMVFSLLAPILVT